MDFDSTDRDESFDSEEKIDSGVETPDKFLPPISKAKNEVGGSSLMEKVINLVENEMIVPLPIRESPQAALNGFTYCDDQGQEQLGSDRRCEKARTKSGS